MCMPVEPMIVQRAASPPVQDARAESRADDVDGGEDDRRARL